MPRRRRRGDNTVIYEAHVKGLTLSAPVNSQRDARHLQSAWASAMKSRTLNNARDHRAGAVARGAISPAAPLACRLGLSNYWGYNPLALFPLDPRYGES